MTKLSTDPGTILRARARVLARSPDIVPERASFIEVLDFRLADERYAVETRHVREVYPLKDLTPLPGTPGFFRGLVNVRGHIVPVVDLKKFFDLPDLGLTDLHRVVLVEGGDITLGLLADAVVGVRAIPVDSLQPTLPTLNGIRSDYLKGVTAERVVVLDVTRILTDRKLMVHEEVDTP